MSRVRAILQALVALVVLAGFVIGIPVALLELAEWPLTEVPTTEQLSEAPSAMLTDDALVGALVVALWAAWALLVLAVVAEIVAQIRGLGRPSVSLGGPVQKFAGFLVGSIAVGLASPAAAGAVSPPALTVGAEAELTAGSSSSELVLETPEGTFEEWVAYLADDDAATPYEPASVSTESAENETITVERDDTAWSLAEEYLGDGVRWREIWELNKDTVQADGSQWANADDDVEPGWRLVLPTDAETGEPPVDATLAVDGEEGDSGGETEGTAESGAEATAGLAATEVAVTPGDHFWGLAEQQLTEAWGRAPSDAEMTPYWQQVVETNRDRLLPPEDPDLIYPEQVFTLPATPADPLAPPPAPAPPPPPAEDESADDETSGEAAEDEADEEQEEASEDGSATEDDSEDGSEDLESSDIGASEDVEDTEDTQGGADQESPPDDVEDDFDHGPPVTAEPTDPDEPADEDPPVTVDPDEPPAEDDESPPVTLDPNEPPGGSDDDDEDDASTTPPTAPGEQALGEGETPSGPDDAETPDTTAAVLLPEVEDAASSAEDEGESSESGSSLAPVGLVGGGIALAGVVLLLERRRRAQQRHRRRGRSVEMPGGDLRAREQELRHGADVAGARLLDVALRAAAAGSGTTGLPPIRWVETTDDSVTLVMDRPSPAPPGFKNLSADRWVTSAGYKDLAVMGASAAPPMPALMPIGTTDDTEILADLEASGVISVEGDREDVVGLLRAMAVAAATAPWHEQTRLLLVGMTGELTDLDFVRSVDRLEDAVTEAEAYADRTASSLRAIDCPTTAQARAAGVMPEQWDPLIVLCATPPEDPELLQRLSALSIRSHSAVAVVVPAPTDAMASQKLTLRGDGELVFQGLDVMAWAHLLDSDDAEDLVSILDVASRRQDVAPEDPVAGRPEPVRRPVTPVAEESAEESEASAEPSAVLESAEASELEPIELESLDSLISEDVTELIGESVGDTRDEVLASIAGATEVPSTEELSGEEATALPARSEVESAADAVVAPIDDLGALLKDVDVLVKVLGEVEAVRLERPGPGSGALERAGRQERKVEVTRQKGLEALAYLALRESAVYKEDLESALFPDGANVAKTLYNTISAARNMVGDELFPRAGGVYELSERVVTDYGLFCELVAQAEETDDAARAADRLTGALSLIQGEPFVGVGRSYAWVGAHRGMIVAQVIDAADELGEVRLAMGDWRAAEWAARQGLRAFPADERMYRLLMRTARAAGNAPGVQRVFRELCDVIADPDLGVEPEDTLHPETVALFEELTGNSPRSGKVTA